MVTFEPWMNTLNREDDPDGRIAAEILGDDGAAGAVEAKFHPAGSLTEDLGALADAPAPK